MPATYKFDDGTEFETTNRLYVMRYAYKKMFTQGYSITEDGKTDLYPFPQKCETCSENFVNRPGKPMLCDKSELNKKFGHHLRICSYCYWYYEKEAGGTIPKSIDKAIRAGFRPNV